jgi:hypothetical protein
MVARMRAGRSFGVTPPQALFSSFAMVPMCVVDGQACRCPAPPCPALPWQTLALPCSCTALARDTDTPLRYASLAIRQCQLWRAGCLPSELDHFARACVSPRPGMDGTAISRACPRPNVTARQVSQMYRQAAADRAARRRRVARRRQGTRRLSAAAGRRVASTARGDCKSLGRYACMAVAYSHRRRFGGPTTAPAPYNSIPHLGSACHARSVAEMGTGSPRIRLDMHCLALQLSLIKGHGTCLRSGSSNRCPALLSSALSDTSLSPPDHPCTARRCEQSATPDLSGLACSLHFSSRHFLK